MRQLHGSKHRYLRLDFGLVEVTFGDEPDWACHWLAVHPHRLVEVPGLAEECEKGFALEFSGIITWEQLSLEVRENAVLVDTSASGVQFRIPTVKATVHLSKNVDDSELGRVIEKIVIGV
ncbi:hypothetical protein ACFYOF_21015 [Streptomyces sp. NPDC007148]|uniref:hypothetical protein n=1 Tax=Streptomyces sp. NPDC007148 TaxID=3364775 RepID=UPI0036D18896